MYNFKKNNILKYLPQTIVVEETINPARVFEYNNFKLKKGSVIYLCEREIRMKDNFALQFAINKAKKINAELKIITPAQKFDYKPKQDFIKKQIERAQQDFLNCNLNFRIIENVQDYINSEDISILIIDFNPTLNRSWLQNLNCKIYEIDGHNIIPARFISNKQEYSAATLRRKIYSNIYSFFTEYTNTCVNSRNEAEHILDEFILNKLNLYYEYRNNPNYNVLSGLSKYLNLGFISSQRVALKVFQSQASEENKEAFLEELIVRKELADNFCLYSNNYKTFDSIPNWAKESLDKHKFDLRNYVYSLNIMEIAQTHDALWNFTQQKLISHGAIHSYLRMYWAKKIFEWSITPQDALEYAIYLNDKYALDSPSSNGYVGILWALGGLHDRAFQDWPVTGKIRRMSAKAILKKYKININN